MPSYRLAPRGLMLHKKETVCLPSYFLHFCLALAALILAGWPAVCGAQDRTEASPFSSRNTVGIFGALSPDSSHIMLGEAENRKLVSLGFSYSRRLTINHTVSWQYDAEIVPLALESDPLSVVVENQTKPSKQTYSYDSGPIAHCSPFTTPYSEIDPVTGITFSGTITTVCHGRRWVVGEAISPAGLRWNFLPEHKMQFFLDAHGGYMYSTKPIPMDDAGSFNFTFDWGAGVEFYRHRNRSLRLEYRYHHISNNNSAPLNPGIDNGLIQAAYCFGLGPR